MSDLLNWLLKKENKKTCRIVGVFLVIPPVAYFFSGGFLQDVDGHGIVLSTGWFQEILLVSLILMLLLGLILIAAGFSKK
ncbi:MAG: hypothetical protein HQ536_01260 [Parcubacteria group bacterium]|nr:hypothetical protein [Parcubacteria group bacterium]